MLQALALAFFAAAGLTADFGAAALGAALVAGFTGAALVVVAAAAGLGAGLRTAGAAALEAVPALVSALVLSLRSQASGSPTDAVQGPRPDA